jgi:hypothetical protein
MPRSTSHRGLGVVGIPALVVALVVACDGGAPAEPRALHLTSVDTLHPGQLAQVRGSGLTSLRSLRLDGFEATELVARSDSVVEFRVPSMRACESDMRVVKVSADGSAPVGAVVRVAPSVSLRPAESRVLTQADLQCLRIPAADEDYILAAAGRRLRGAVPDGRRATRDLAGASVDGAGGAHRPADAAALSGKCYETRKSVDDWVRFRRRSDA